VEPFRTLKVCEKMLADLGVADPQNTLDAL
jgi:hypothetical protein